MTKQTPLTLTVLLAVIVFLLLSLALAVVRVKADNSLVSPLSSQARSLSALQLNEFDGL